MGPMTWVLLLLMLGSGALTAGLVRHRRRFDAAAARARLHVHQGVARGALSEDYAFRVHGSPWGGCTLTAPWDGDLHLRPRDPVLDASEVGVRTGDRAFDRAAVLTSARPLQTLLRLDAPRRAELVRVLTHVDLELTGGQLVARGSTDDMPRLVAAARLVAGLLRPDEALPAVRERWASEPDGAVRACLLAVGLTTSARPEVIELAGADDDPSVHEVLAAEFDDPEALLQLFLDADDERLADRCFRRLRERDADGLATDLVDALFLRGPTARIRTRLGALRSPGVIPRMAEGWPGVPAAQQEALAPVLLGIAVASDKGAPLAEFAVSLMQRVPSRALWQEGLTVLRQHGTLLQLAALPATPPAVAELYRRTKQVIEVNDAATELAARYPLTISDRRVYGRVHDLVVTVLLEPPRVVVQLEGLPETLGLTERDQTIDGQPVTGEPFDDRFEPVGEITVWSPRLRRLADQLASGHGLGVGGARPGVLQWRGDHLSIDLFDHALAVCQALIEAQRVPVEERLATLLGEETHPEWLCRWLDAARCQARPHPKEWPWLDDPDPRVRACAAAWRGDLTMLGAVLGELTLPGRRRFVAERMLALGSEGVRRLLDADLTLAVSLISDAETTTRGAATADLATWWAEHQAEARPHYDAILALSLEHPCPEAEDLWCAAVRGGRGSGPRLLDAMQSHGTVVSAKALREAASRGSGVWAKHCRAAYERLTARLDVAGAVSVASATGGHLAVADAGRGGLSEVP